MILYWDRAGYPIEEVLEWARLYEQPAYRFVALDIDGERQVSTIWDGLDRALGRLDTPMIFSTGYFVGDELLDEFQWPSEEAALLGHDLMCRELLGRPARPEDGHLQRAIEEDGHGPQ